MRAVSSRMDAVSSLNAALVGRYLIEREIGRGGMATVYLARDLRHQRLVALKVLDPELAAVLGSERFLSEIRVTANLQHPHLLPLFDSGEAYGLLFYVMPYVEGESLRARLDREKQLPVDEAIRLTAAVLSALEYAHARGVIHRDLKPGNILLQSGEPVVADFGIALAVSNAGGARITQTGLSLGTPQYMSPEQATGDRMIDARSDIYSVGAVLYEMLVGEPPHTGNTVQAIIAKVVTERPRSVRLARDTVPESIDFAVTKALAKLPADRWASAGEFADSLHDTTAVFTAPAQRLSAAVQQVRHGVPSLVFWRALAAVLLVAAGALGWLAFRPRARAADLQLARQLTFDGNVVGAAISPDGAWLAYVIDECYGQQFACARTLRVREVDGSQSVKLLTWPSMGSDVRWSPEGTMVGFMGSPDSTGSALYLVPRLGGTPQRVSTATSAWAFGPNGQLLIVTGPAGRQSLAWLDQRTLANSSSAALPSGFLFRDLDLTRNGQRIAAIAQGRTTTLMLLDGRGRLLDSTTAFSVRPTVRWDASNTGILVTTTAPGTADNVRRIPVSRGTLDVKRAQIALGQVGDGTDGLIDASGSGRVAIVAGPTSFEILTLRLGDPAATWMASAQHTSWVWAQGFSPDGLSIIGSATDNMGDNVYVFPVAGGSPRSVTTQHGIRDFPFWSADGRHVAYNALGAESMPIGVMFTDLAGGRERPMRMRDLEEVTGWMGNDALVLFRPGALTIVDTTGSVRKSIPLPDSLAPTPWSRIIGSSGIHTDAVSGRSFYWSAAARAVIAVDLSSGQLARLVATTTPVLPVGWGSDGSLYVAAEASAATPGPAGSAPRRDRVIERLPPGGSIFVRIATLPSSCWTEMGGVSVARNGTLAACTVRRYAPDVWLADRSGESGW